MRVFARIYQQLLKQGVKLMNFKMPKTYRGIHNILEIIENENIKKPLIITGNHIYSSGLIKILTNVLDDNKISYAIFHDVPGDPTIKSIYEAKEVYDKENCDSIIAFGGGSPMDAAKCVGILATNAYQDLRKYRKLLSVKKDLPCLICVPTTCGTGSETTVAAVVRDEDTQEKYAISDPHLIPKYAIFENKTLENLPSNVLAATVMDAMTHAIESYISLASTKETRAYSLDAIKLIHDNINDAYFDNSLKAKDNLLRASYLAGAAFTRAFVGYVHSIAHALGVLYHLPHGYLCAILLPILLLEYFDKIVDKLDKIAHYISLDNLGDSKEDNARALIEYIMQLNESFGIPKKVKELKLEDIDIIVKKAQAETIPSYPVPIIFSDKKLRKILIEKVKGE